MLSDRVRSWITHQVANYGVNLLAGFTLLAVSRGLGIWVAGTLSVCTVAVGLVYAAARPYRRVYRPHRIPMRYRGGDLRREAQAHSPRVWHVIGGQNPAGAALYGPYVKLRPGTYIADFRLRVRQDVPGQGTFCFDVAHSVGDSEAEPVGNARAWVNDDTGGQYGYRSHRFVVEHEWAEHNFEFRIIANEPGVEIWVDEITVTRC